jgi:hypothetical protein
VTLTGAGFAPDVKVTVSGDDVRVTNVSVNGETEITATFSIGAHAKPETRELTVTGSGGSSNSLKFHLVGPNAIQK